MKKTLADMVNELVAISGGLSKGLFGIAVPPVKSERPRWCKCNRCGAWHHLAK